MSRKAAPTQAVMQRMKRAIERERLPFRGYRWHPDGSVDALVGEPLTEPGASAASSDPLDAELAEWDAKHGYGRP